MKNSLQSSHCQRKWWWSFLRVLLATFQRKTCLEGWTHIDLWSGVCENSMLVPNFVHSDQLISKKDGATARCVRAGWDLIYDAPPSPWKRTSTSSQSHLWYHTTITQCKCYEHFWHRYLINFGKPRWTVWQHTCPMM
jgi:hypothetical protein